MKTLLKLILCLFLISAATLTGAYFYLTNENVQKDFVLSALQENFGENAKFESFSLGLSSLYIKDLKIKTEKFNFNSEEISISYQSPISLLFNELNIENAELKNATLELLKEEILEEAQATKEAIPQEEAAQNINAKAPNTSEIAIAHPETENTEEEEKSFLEKLIVNVENLDANLLIKDESQELALLNLKAQNIEIHSLKDLKKAFLTLEASKGLLDEEITLQAQVKDVDSMRSLNALIISKRDELLKISAEYSPDFKDISMLSSAKISKENLPKNLIRELGDSFNLDFYAKLDSKNFFSEVDLILNADASTGNLRFSNDELNLLSNTKLKLNAELKKDSKVLSVKTLDGEIHQNDEILAQLKLNKILSIENNQLADNEDLKDFASLYIDHIPFPVLRNYLHEYDFNTNKVKAHLSLSLDPQKNEISIGTKDEFYIKGLEILKNEAPLLSDVFLGANFIVSIDANKKIFTNFNLRFKESKNSELKANITAEIIDSNITAHIFASGDAITLLNTAQAHVDNIEAIKNSQLDLNLRLSKKGENLEIYDIVAKLYEKDYELFELISSDRLYFKNYQLQNETLKAKILAKALPFAPFKAYVMGINATSISCDIDIEKSADTILASGKASIENLSFSQDNKALFEHFYPEIEFSAKYENDDIDTQIQRFTLSYKDSQILRANADIKANLKAKNYITKATSKTDIYVPSLMKIDGLKDYNNIQSAHAEVTLDFDGEILKTDAKLTNLKLKSEAGYISSINLESTKNLFEEEKDIDLKLKISSPNGQSDIATKTNFKDKKIDSAISSKNLILDDLIFLSKIASKSYAQEESFTQRAPSENVNLKMTPKPKLTLEERKAQAMKAAKEQIAKEEIAQAPALKEAKVERKVKAQTESESDKKIATKLAQTHLHEKAIWDAGYEIQAKASLEKLTLKGEKILADFKGSLLLDENSIKSENIEFKLLNASDGKGSFSLDFDKSKKAYYNLNNLKLSLSNINTKALSFNKKTKSSLMEGIVNFDLNLNSSAHSLELLADKIKGKATLTNEGAGVIRLVNANSTMGAATEMASSLMGLAGSFFGDSVKEIAPINTLLDIFKEFKYSELSASITRGDNLDIVIDEILIRNEGNLAILGDGKITYDASKAIADQDLNIVATIYVEDDDLAGLFEKLNLLEEETDVEGYYKGASFEATGSLNNMQNNVFEILSDSATSGASNLLNSFFE